MTENSIESCMKLKWHHSTKNNYQRVSGPTTSLHLVNAFFWQELTETIEGML